VDKTSFLRWRGAICYAAIKVMRLNFERDVRNFGEIAKKEAAAQENASLELDSLSQALDRLLEKAAERQHTDIETQKEIYNLQNKKQEIMRRLKEQLSCLDDPECRFERMENERLARFDEAVNGFKYEDDNGNERVASFGDLVTDIDWGIRYFLSKDSPRRLIKRYLVESAKYELRELLDLQIIKSEVGGDIAHEARQRAYRAVEEERASGVAKERWGLISETIVKNLLKKFSIDKNLPFEVKESDIFQDVEQKIDFIIHRKEKARGVNVETDERTQDVGIQFSVSPRVAGKKKHQIEKSKRRLKEQGERIQDIVLVIFPLTIAHTLKEKWIKNGKIAGGPGKFLRRKVAKKLFSELLRNILTKDEINNSWQAIQGHFPE